MLLIKVFFINKHVTLFFYCSKNKEITLPHEFVFVFIRYFIRAILSKKFCQKRGVRKKYKKGGWPEEGFKPSAHYELYDFEGEVEVYQ